VFVLSEGLPGQWEMSLIVDSYEVKMNANCFWPSGGGCRCWLGQYREEIEKVVQFPFLTILGIGVVKRILLIPFSLCLDVWNGWMHVQDEDVCLNLYDLVTKSTNQDLKPQRDEYRHTQTHMNEKIRKKTVPTFIKVSHPPMYNPTEESIILSLPSLPLYISPFTHLLPFVVE
jgi:hypothetical protein